MRVRRVLTVASMHARDLGRRRLALLILVALPLLFYVSAEMQPADSPAEAPFAEGSQRPVAAQMWPVVAGGLGAGWAIAVAALFVMVGSRRADQPLLLSGFRPAELLAGRVLTVLALAAVITPLFAAVIRLQRDIDFGTLTLAIALSSLVAVATGVAAAALVPREMEGVLVIIGVVGIQMGNTPGWMPLWGSDVLLQRASGVATGTTVAAAATHSLIFTAALLALGMVLWRRRTGLRTSDPIPVPVRSP